MAENDFTRVIELLAPAKNSETAIEAIKHGADAVYIGASKFGARASAGNSIDDIKIATEFAHQFNAKIYVTVNTIVYDNELKEIESLIKSLYKVGVDALIIQDMGILRLDLPPIQLHASTQCDTRTVEKAKFLESVGFSQIVLARELTLDEIKQISSSVSVPIECFIHGALCVSYSGRCNASCAFRGRSANRGECAQICRLPYDLYDNGKPIMTGKHLLSLRDFNMSANIEKLLEAGASSLKIEGRLKDTAYVKNITAYYSRLLDNLCKLHPDRYRRASAGITDIKFTPSPEKSFNRGFTTYFTDERNPNNSMASLNTPKSLGEYIGKVINTSNKGITVATDKELTNGDGLVYFNGKSELCGFRANKVANGIIYPLEKTFIPKGTLIYRNYDKSFNDSLSKDSAQRYIPIAIGMRKVRNGIAVEASDSIGNNVAARYELEYTEAKTDQYDTRLRTLGKLGDTVFRLTRLELNDTANLFIPASKLSEIKKDIINKLTQAKRINYHFQYRRIENRDTEYPVKELSFSDNVANNMSRQFYTEHGVKSIEPAMEITSPNDNDILMTTRYCLRRELNCCLKGNNRGKLGNDLTIVSGDVRMKIEFDCRNCQMLLHKA